MACSSVFRPHPVLRLAPVLAALTLGLLPAPCGAAEGDEAPLRAGAWALEFEIDPDLSYGFTYSAGATLAVKRHCSPGSAIRFGVAAGFVDEEGDGRRAEIHEPPIGGGLIFASVPTERHLESHNYAAFVHLVRERKVSGEIGTFLEAGPSFQYQELNQASLWAYGLPSTAYSYQQDAWIQRSVALDAKLGFEWFFSKRLSLGARYGLTAAYTWGAKGSTYDNYDVAGTFRNFSSDQIETHGTRVNTLRATLALATYF